MLRKEMNKLACISMLFLGGISYSLISACRDTGKATWNRLYISQIIPFEDLEQISVKNSGFLQSETTETVARLSKRERIDEILCKLRTSEFDSIKETEEHFYGAKEDPRDPDSPIFVEFSKTMGVISVYWFHL